MSSFGLIKFLKDADVIPNILSIEQMEEIMMKMLVKNKIIVFLSNYQFKPAVSVKEHHFYSNSKLIHIYEKDIAKNEDPKYEGDPQLCFHEFQLILSRIAMDTYPKDITTEKRDFDKPLYRFFNEILCIRPNDQIKTKPLPNMNRKFFSILEASYLQFSEDQAGKNFSIKQKDDEDDFVDPKKLLMEYTNKNQFESNLATIDYLETYKTLDRELPQLPDPLKL